MFKVVDLNLNAGPLKNAWLRLNRQIQTEVEHKRVTNAEGGAMARGDVVCATTGQRQVLLATAADPETSNDVGVMAEPTASGSLGVMRTRGYAYVRFEDGLDLVEGTQCFVSDTDAGAATDEQPGDPLAIGIIADAQDYVTEDNHFAWVILGHCCLPEEVPE